MTEASTSSAVALPAKDKAAGSEAATSIPLAKEPASSKGQSLPSSSFQDFSHLLDVRVLRALAKLGFSHPTPVQSEVLPLALSGSDILARARTGSGKTLAYGLPILQKILLAKKSISRGDINYQVTRAIILVPTRELSEQVTSQIGALLPFLDKEVKIVNVARDASKKVHKILLAEKPDIVVSTPSRAFDHFQHERLDLKSFETLAVDEADLILSYGHDESLRALLSSANLPKSIQYLCMSATMTQDIQALKGLVLKRATVLDIPDPPMSTLTQFCVQVSSATDKFLLTYVILRLRLIRGKCIIFVNDIDRCYRLKLFLEQFGVKSTVLNEELPVNSRYHIVQEFNKGVYDYIIATDESQLGADAAVEIEKTKESNGEGKGKKKASEYGVSRGIDFVSVSCVLNFDLPVSVKGYTHRVGRTARAGKTGTSLSYVVSKEVYDQDVRGGSGDRHLICKTTEKDEKVWAKIVQQETAKGQEIKEWKFDRAQIEAFRYRMEDGLRSVTKASIREARIREIKAELLNSDRLKAHFEDNPTDLEYLRHDKVLHPTRVQAHLKHIPGYLMPRIRGTKTTQIAEGDAVEGKGGETNESNKRVRTEEDGVGFVSFGSKKHQHSGRGGRGRGRGRGGMTRGGGPMRKRNDPLRKFGK
jgi:ATP-dependent RNA helicase DDX56/DBP9